MVLKFRLTRELPRRIRSRSSSTFVRHTRDRSQFLKMDPSDPYKGRSTSTMAYTNCTTQTVNLLEFDLPENATETEYKALYQNISRSRSRSADMLTDAVNSVSLGIAPPVAFPTETVYGLGADATNKGSIAGIFAAKGRPSDNPLIVHVSSKAHLERLIGGPIPPIYETLVEDYWPGPLTILVPVPKQPIFAKNVHPGQSTIGFRVPSSKYARFFIAATERPIAAPSANSSGKPSPTIAQHVTDDMQGKINFVLDGGSCDVGVESTVVDGLCDPPLILRPGGVSQSELMEHGARHNNAWARTAIGYKQQHSARKDGTSLVLENGLTEAPRAPGMKYKHYAPHGKMILFEGDHKTYGRVNSEIDHLIDDTLIMTPSQLKHVLNNNDKNHSENDIQRSSEPQITIAILTTTMWSSPFVDLPLDNIIVDDDDSCIISKSHSDTANSLRLQKAMYRGHVLYSLRLGTTSKQIARSLFAALRTCDDLQCHFILAEAPLNPRHSGTGNKQIEDGDYRYDAVIERMRKAASEVVV